MNKYEKLIKEAEQENVCIYEYDLGEENLEGLYIDNNIAISKNITTINRKACVLAEELGHYHTSCGNILNQNSIDTQKQEYKARKWAYEKVIPEDAIHSALLAGCQCVWEIAEHLDVDEKFLRDALICYGYLDI